METIRGGTVRTKDKNDSHCGGRTLHLVDLENLVGDPRASASEAAAALAAYREVALVVDGDHAVIACNANNGAMAFAAADAWPGCLVKVAHGEDGADNALLGTCDPDHVVARYSRVVVASGDHAFTGLTSELRRRGVVVTVISRASALARDLRRVACVCHHLPEIAGVTPARAAA
jgi:hypothetical protein